MSKTNINFLAVAKPMTILSAILTLLSWVLVAVVGLNFGIDFAGGTEALISVPASAKLEEESLKKIAADVGLTQAEVVRYAFQDQDQKGFFIRSRSQQGLLFEKSTALKGVIAQNVVKQLITWTDDQNFSVVDSLSKDLSNALKGTNTVEENIQNLVNDLKKSAGLTWNEEKKNFSINSGTKSLAVNTFQNYALKTWNENDENKERIIVAFVAPLDSKLLGDAIAEMNLNGVVYSKQNELRNPDYVLSTDESARLKNAVVNALKAANESEAVYAKVQIPRFEKVGATAGEQLRNQGTLSIIYALFFILVYVALRFDPRYSPGAILALVHDVSLILGVFVITGKEFNLPIIAALLAIIGYSLNDTIVIYDRIRENLAKKHGLSLREVINMSINETLSRTLLTSGTTLIAVASIYIWGGGIVQNFALAILVGIIVGTYSSVYVASMLVIATDDYINQKEELAKEVNKALNS